MYIRFLNSIAVALPLALSCAKNDKVTPPQPDPKAALQLSRFEVKTFADLPLEAKCEGIKGFFLDFQRNYLPDVEVSFNPKSCKNSQISAKSSTFDVRPIFKKGDDILEMGVLITFTLDKDLEKFTPYRPSFFNYTDNKWLTFDPEDSDEFLGTNFLTLENTFSKWLNVNEKHPVRIYGHSFSEFVALVERRYGQASEGMTLTHPAVKFRIVPDPQKKAEGTIDFLEADLSKYTTNESGEIVQEKFLNCLDLACLKSTKITYDITTHLNLYSEPTPDVENPDWLHQDIFSIPLFFLEGS